jgi:hypothetical protein
MRAPICLAVLVAMLGGCATPGEHYPSLQPRAAETIDPRVAVERPINDRPVAPALAAKLRALVGEARAGNADFDRAADIAEQAAGGAGPASSESWIAAQQARSAAIAARKPTVGALADIDAVGASALQAQGGIAPNDLEAIQAAAAEAGAIDQRQAARIDAIQRRLAR